MLVVFDFDGALAVSDPFVLLGEQHGVGTDVAGILDRIRVGDIDYEDGLRTIADRLEGLPVDDVEAAYSRLQIRDGFPELAAELDRAGHDVAVVSDAPEAAIESTFGSDVLTADHVVGNRLPTDNGALTGEIEGPLVDQRKDAALKELVARTGAGMHETIAVGDDERDLPMLQAAATGVGLAPSPVVADQCDRVEPTLARLHQQFGERGLV